MLPFEWLAVLYFAALAAAALAQRRGRPRTGMASLYSIGLATTAIVASGTMPADARVWLGHVYLLGGYWVPSLLAPTPGDTRFERWLAHTDRRWRSFAGTMPGPASDIFELAYLLCYPLVPAAFVVVWTGGGEHDSVRFWLAVLTAGFACYGLLPWVVSRPPRSLPGEMKLRGGIARLNAFVLERASHRLNTFPSGHVAVSVAAALSVWPVSHAAATVFVAMSVGIAVGAIVGRYHYLPDVVIGAAIGVVAPRVAAMWVG